MGERLCWIVVSGRLSPSLVEEFNGLDVTFGDGRTTLSGALDSAGFYGVVERVHRSGLELISLRREARGRHTLELVPCAEPYTNRQVIRE